MKRTAVLIDNDEKTFIYVDKLNSESLIDYIRETAKRIKRFEFIKNVIKNRLNHDCYKREIIEEENIRDVNAMRFDLHDGNGRVYCKHLMRGEKILIVIACELQPSKKGEDLGNDEKTLIRKVHSYEYDI